jgi:RNA polymerase sigma-70 factor (ECF subfamily)
MDTPSPAARDETADALLRRFRATRDPGDFAALFDGTAPRLFRAAVRLTRDGAAAEEVLQETFLAVLVSVDGWDPARPAGPWLMGVLQRKAADAWRRRERDARPLPRPEAAAVDPAAEAERNEDLARVRAALEGLDEPYRRVAVLRWRYGLEPGEIADALGEPPGTVRSLLSRAREKLERTLTAAPLLAFLGDRAPKGLDAVRTTVLREAAHLASPAAAAAAGGAALATGGLLMANKALAATAAVLLLAGAGWLAFRPGNPPRPPSRSLAAADRVAPRPVPPVPAGAEAPRAETGDIPPPVDPGKCDRDLDLFGRVEDEKGIPVPGARVESRFNAARRESFLYGNESLGLSPGPRTRAAADGTFAIRLRRGALVDLQVAAEGFAETIIPNCLAGERVRAVLRRGATVRVVARDEHGNLVPDVRVRFWRWPDGADAVFDRTGTTGPDGVCLFAGLTPGRAEFSAEHPVLGRAEGAFTAVPRSGTRTIEISLKTGLTVYGRVSEAVRGTPIEKARVFWHPVPGRAFLTDAEGRYAYAGWAGGSSITWLTAEAEGYGAAMAEAYPLKAVDFVLSAEDRAEGRVVSADGVPVGGALVAAFAPYRAHSTDWDRARTVVAGPDGRFLLRGLRHDLSHSLLVRAEGHGKLLRSFDPAANAPGLVSLGDVALPREASIEGTVVGDGDRPLPGRNVRLEGPTGAFGEGPGPDEVLRTDDLGRFRFYGIGPGAYRVTLRSNRYVLETPPIEVRLDEGGHQRGVLLRTHTARVLRARVVDPSGEPVPGVTVWALEEAAKSVLSCWSDADGRVVFEGLPEGKFRLTAGVFEGSGLPFAASERTEPLDAGAPEATLVLREEGFVRGTLLDVDGRPLPQMEIRATSTSGGGLYIVASGPDGAFEIRAPRGETLRLEIPGTWWRIPGDKSSREPCPLPHRAAKAGVPVPSEGVVIREESPTHPTLAVRLLDLEGNPMPGARVFAWTYQGATFNEGTGPDGIVRFEFPYPDEVTVQLLPRSPEKPLPPCAVLPAPVKVVPAGQEITVRLREGIARTGIVKDADDRPAPGAWVSLKTEDLVESTAKAADDGTFTVWVAPGLKVVRAEAALGAQEGPGSRAEIEGDAVPAEGEIVLRLGPVKAR